MERSKAALEAGWGLTPFSLPFRRDALPSCEVRDWLIASSGELPLGSASVLSEITLFLEQPQSATEQGGGTRALPFLLCVGLCFRELYWAGRNFIRWLDGHHYPTETTAQGTVGTPHSISVSACWRTKPVADGKREMNLQTVVVTQVRNHGNSH